MTRARTLKILVAASVLTVAITFPSIVQAQSAQECVAPLACEANKSCLTFSEASRNAEQLVRDQPYIRAGLGTCGDLKYVYRNTGRGGETLFFDAQGRLVAQTMSSDALVPPCFGSQHYGIRVTCQAVVTREFKK